MPWTHRHGIEARFYFGIPTTPIPLACNSLAVTAHARIAPEREVPGSLSSSLLEHPYSDRYARPAGRPGARGRQDERASAFKHVAGDLTIHVQRSVQVDRIGSAARDIARYTSSVPLSCVRVATRTIE